MYGDSNFEMEAQLAEPMEPKQQPHIGYALLFIVLYVAAPILIFAVLAGFQMATHHLSMDALRQAPQAKGLTIVSSLFGALAALLVAWPLFQALWQRPFWKVLAWHWPMAAANAGRLLGLGFVLSIVAQAAEHWMTLPQDMPIDSFFQSRSLLWWLTFYGAIVAPLAEETLFRGLLLPSIARAIDWMRQRPVPPELEWKYGISKSSLAISAILTSIAFGMVHAAQLGHAWNAVALLSGVGLVLAFIRIRFNSLAASAMVHAAYNGSLFLAMYLATGGYRHLDVLSQK